LLYLISNFLRPHIVLKLIFVHFLL
jgi:hypothetical protein